MSDTEAASSRIRGRIVGLGPRLLLLLGSLAVMLCLFEVGLRLAGYQPIYDVYSKPSIFWQADDLLGWSHAPSSGGVYRGPRPWPLEFDAEIRINSLGLRGGEIDELPTDGYRVLVLGDSMVAAFEVPYQDTFIARAERRLNDRFDFPVQLINGGVRAYGTDQSYLYYKERGRLLDPDLVVFLHSSNDTRDNMTLHRIRRPFGKAGFRLEPEGSLRLQGVPVPHYPICSVFAMDEAYRVVRSEGLVSRLFCWFETNAADHSALFTFATYTIRRSPGLMRWLRATGTPERNFSSDALRLLLPGVAHADGLSDAAFRLTGALIRAMASEVRASGARFLLIVAPEQLEDLGLQDFGEEGTSWRPLQLKRVSDIPLTFKNDGHWNGYGHRLIGDAVADLIDEQIRLERR